MSVRRTIFLRIGIVASLAVFGQAAAQPHLAVTAPTNSLDDLATTIMPTPPPLGGDVQRPGVGRVSNAPAGAARALPSGAREPRGNPLWAIPLKSLTFTRDRPLFTPSRRPPAPPVADIEPPPPVVAVKPAEPERRPQLSLIGVMVSEKDAMAIFLDETTREVLRLRKNQGHNGWILRSIQGREATLEKVPFMAVLVIPLPGEQKPIIPLLGQQRSVQNQQGDPL
jgi:hypothetical protein